MYFQKYQQGDGDDHEHLFDLIQVHSAYGLISKTEKKLVNCFFTKK